jgi:molecular chaperone DnaK
MLKRVFGADKIDASVNPDEVVAQGAAIQGSILAGDTKDILLLDVTPLSLGIETKGGVFTKIVEKNSTIPAKKTQQFTTAEDGQTSVTIAVFQGERVMAKDNKQLGTFNLDGIPSAKRGVPVINVTFDIDANGILNVSAKDQTSGKECSVKIQSSKLSDEEVERMREESLKYEEEDKKRLKLVTVVNEAETLLHSTQNSLDEYKDKVPSDFKAEVEEKMTALRSALITDNVDTIESAKKDLTDTVNKMYEKVSGAAGADANADANSEANTENNEENK